MNKEFNNKTKSNYNEYKRRMAFLEQEYPILVQYLNEIKQKRYTSVDYDAVPESVLNEYLELYHIIDFDLDFFNKHYDLHNGVTALASDGSVVRVNAPLLDEDYKIGYEESLANLQIYRLDSVEKGLIDEEKYSKFVLPRINFDVLERYIDYVKTKEDANKYGYYLLNTIGKYARYEDLEKLDELYSRVMNMFNKTKKY